MFIMSTPTWVDTISDIQTSYNDSPNRSLLGYTPRQIVENEHLRKKLSKHYAEERVAHHRKYEKRFPRPLLLHSQVRIVNMKKVFDKDYGPSFSEKVFKIIRVYHNSVPEVYQVNDGTGRKYYREELSPVLDLANEARRNLYIDGTRKTQSKTTRSGQKYHSQTEYKLKSVQNPSEIRWIKEDEFEALKRKNLIK